MKNNKTRKARKKIKSTSIFKKKNDDNKPVIML